MRIIPRRKKSKAKKPTLTLSVRISQARHIDLVDKFQCNPVCFVTTNTFYTKRTSKLKNSRTNWNQILKVKLPRNPKSDLLRIIVFDALPTVAPNTTASSTPPYGTSPSSSVVSLRSSNSYTAQSNDKNNIATSTMPKHSSADLQHYSTGAEHLDVRYNDDIHSSKSTASMDHYHSESHAKRHVTSKYLYIGEVQLSLLDIFRRKGTMNSYNFSLAPEWYTLYDKKHEKEQHDSGVEHSYPVGEIQLGFNLASNIKNRNTIEAYNIWKSSLISGENSKGSQKKLSPSVSQNKERRNRARTISDARIETLKIADLQDDTSHTLSDGEFDHEHSVLSSGSSSSSIDSAESTDAKHFSSDEYSIADISMEGLIENFEMLSNVVSTADDGYSDAYSQLRENTGINTFDITSIATVLDEYDVVNPAEINKEKIPNLDLLLNGDMIPEEDLAEDMPLIDNKHLVKLREEDNSRLSFDSDNLASGYEDEDERSVSGSESSGDDDNENTNNGLIFRPTVKKLIRMRRRTKSYKEKITRKVETTFQVSKRQHSLGVMFVEFLSITDLPPMKSKLSRTFDMDPFVVASFGRRVFKTSWRKHTLNPHFNESATFEVFPNEENFSFHFRVMDKDSFTFNDEIAEYDLPWSDMIRELENKDPTEWTQFALPLKLLVKEGKTKYEQPVMRLKMRFIPYVTLKKTFWKHVVLRSTIKNHFDMCDLILFLDKLGSFTDSDVLELFAKFKKKAWSGGVLSRVQLIEGLQTWKKSAEFKNVWRCPKCFKSRKKGNNILKSKLMIENDLITHFAICSFSHANKTLQASYVSSEFASKRWFSKVLIKLTYGKYAVGSNNANILVQDRDTGIVIEEKISAHVKLGMRIIYNGRGTETKKFKTLLKNMSIKQGRKFDDPASAKQIESFIKFHSLDMSQCLDMEYKTFNSFFYRKLKPGSRTIEGNSNKVMVSPADSRCTVFESVSKSRELWIKGSKFSIKRLTNDYSTEKFNDGTSSIAIFRLAPQDYHRFHSPCHGTIGKPIYVDGEYYTVNPMAIRSELDVFGENIRVVLPIHSPEFGTFLFIPVGAMMVGSIILTRKEGETVERGDELGYFKFGGSTIIIVVPRQQLTFDSDLIKNSNEGIETLVKVGMSVGHTPGTRENRRQAVRIVDSKQLEKIKRTISVDEEHVSRYHNVSWEYRELERFMSQDYGKDNFESMA